MVLRDFNRGRPEGGELFAATPSLMAVKLLLVIGSIMSLTMPDFICLLADVTQAFVHAPIDEVIQTRVPDSLDGLEVQIGGQPVILVAGMLLDVCKALYGYRKSPRLWQDWFSERLERLQMNRSKVEPTIYREATHEIFAALHVDDMMIFGRQLEWSVF